MSTDTLAAPERIRGLLSRHSVAIETVLAASVFARCGAQIVVFEERRVFIVASSLIEVLQPRLPLDCEAQLLETKSRAVTSGGSTAFAITDETGRVVAALTLMGATNVEESGGVDGFHALCRTVAGVLRSGLHDLGEEPIERAVLDGLRDVVVVLDQNLTIKWVNRAVGSLLSRTSIDMIGRSAADLLHPDDVALAFDAVTRLSAGLEIYRVFVRVERGGGGYERVEVTGVDQSAHPQLGGVVLSLRGAEVAEELQASVERANRMSDAILAGLHDGIVATDQFGAITMVNAIARQMFGLDPDAAPSSLGLADFAMLDESGRPIDHDPSAPLGIVADSNNAEVCVVNPSGNLRYLMTERRPVRDGGGNLLGNVISFHDVTETRRAADQLRSQALHDQLTGLANRRQLEHRLAQLAAESATTVVAACFIDLDSFKLINDTYGHRLGDEIIQIAANRLRSTIRPGDLLVRQGGDEFVALLIGVRGSDDARANAERFRLALSQPYVVGQERFDLTASVGIAHSANDKLNDDTLLRHADLALYAAKARGRNRTELFDDDLASAVEIEERQRRMLKGTLDSNQLTMHFQPLINTNTGKADGYEALARFRDEHHQLVGPGTFVDAIHRSGLMWDLDQEAFQLSCQAAAVLAKVAPGTSPIVACNFSAVSLVQAQLVEFVTTTVAKNGISPHQICIEITESSAFDAGPGGLASLTSLNEAGFRLALDDFGTGYSSLAHLRDLPLTSVKVDRSFIAKLTGDSPERAITEAIVKLAKDLGLEVVAEGVETAEQLEIARRLGFSTIQGWHYSPALALDQILTDWL